MIAIFTLGATKVIHYLRDSFVIGTELFLNYGFDKEASI